MKIQKYIYPQSSFLSIDKDTNIILNKILSDHVLLKLIKYPSADALEKPNLTEEEALDLLGNSIKLIPKIYVDSAVKVYLIINFNDFVPNMINPYYRDNMISFNIVCHYETWQLSGKFATLRPYRIAGQIDSLFNNSKLTGIGTLEFRSASQIQLNDQFGGIRLDYGALHSDDDTNPKALSPSGEDIMNPNMAELLIDNFNEMHNQ